MLLSISDRMLLLSILPPEGDITTVRILRELREDLSFTEEEHAAADFQVDGPNVRWKQGVVEPREIHIGDAARAIIVAALKELNDNKKLTASHVPIYEHFVENGKCPTP